jgi:dynein heavy chain
MEALTNIYLNSVKFLVQKLNMLSQIKVDYEFDASKSQFGESKRVIMTGPEPLFHLEGEFNNYQIRESDLSEIKIKKFIPPPVGLSTSKDFDPIVHLELEEDRDYEAEEEIDILDESDEESKYKTKLVCHNIHKLLVKMNPSKTSFIELLDESINQGYLSLKSIERWSRHGELLKYVKVLESWDDKVCDEWDPPDENYLDCDSWLDSEELRVDQKKIINEYMEDAFGKADRYITNFKPYLQVYYDNLNIDYHIILHEKLKNPQEVLPELLKRLNKQIDDFDNYLPEVKDLGLLRIDFTKIKQKLKPNPKEVFDKIKKDFPFIIKERIRAKKDWLLARIDSITSTVIDVDQFVKQVQALEFIDKHFQDVKDEIDLYQNLHRICAQNGIVISKEDTKLISEIYTIISNLSQAVMDASDSIDQKKKSNVDNIRKKIPIFQAEVKEYREKISNPKLLDINNDVNDMLSKMKLLEKECERFIAISKKYQEWQLTLDMELNQFVEVEEIKREIQDRISLWSAIKDWQFKVDGWVSAPFESIDTETISQEADKYQRIVNRCERGLPADSSAVKHLKSKVYEFKDTMPIVTALGNKELMEDHWRQIMREVPGIDFELEKKEFSLGQLIDINIADYQEVIQGISIRASQEASLKRQLDTIKEVWEKLEFTFKMYKDNVYVLTEIEEIQIQLDENLTNINNIMGNRYIKKHQADGNIMKKNLDLFTEIFDQWKECQHNWQYLENIFLSEDIRNQTRDHYNKFEKVNKKFTELMRAVIKDNRIKNYCKKNILKDLVDNNEIMEEVQKQLNDFLERKRIDFPRFFFLSNDELLQIIAAAQDINKIEKHLNKIFESISRLKLGEGLASNQILSIVSGEGEIVKLVSSIKIKTEENVEKTLDDIEKGMYETIKRKISVTYNEYEYGVIERKVWVLSEIGQAITTVSQILWTEMTSYYIGRMIETKNTSLSEQLEDIIEQLKEQTLLIRGKLDPIKRKILISLITVDVHNRDIITSLDEQRVDTVDDFEWQKQLRYSMVEDLCIVKQINATLHYGYEYMGAASRLVITPLTDRCWITITGALHIKLGAAPAGPAGTGKTESTKDLAKALGIQCIVFNCSEQIDYKMMARLFSGLVSQGAWACLDEFNRIDEEVLSVIAQQLLTIRFALLNKAENFEFNGVEKMKLNPMCGVFVTMNPGYEGRTELPDNLAVLFRSVSMMIPNYGLIAEIMLFAEGFENAQTLSVKMVQLYKLASEQLSQQKHYDFGMRAVKSVLVMAGALKRENPNLEEEVVLIRAMRDSNIPKFLAEDLPLFKALIQDLFPKAIIPEIDYGELQSQIVESIKYHKMEPKEEFITKVIQLFDTFNVRFGVMIVGPTCGGKTACYQILSHAMTTLRVEKHSKDIRFQSVHIATLNPKSITMGELYGQENPDTKEWTDGLASKILRENAEDESSDRRWCIFDGPVDALWIENMNTVLDDTMALCLANGERIKLRTEMRILFETKDLAVASPATVSRCGMVYMTPKNLGWVPYVNCWMRRMFSERSDDVKSCLNPEGQIFLRELFDSYVDESLDKLNKLHEFEPMPTFEIQKITCLCNFLEYFVSEEVGGFNYDDKKEQFRHKLSRFFAYSFIWAFGSSYNIKALRYVDNIMRYNFEKLKIPPAETVFEYYLDIEEMKFKPWDVPSFEYNPKNTFFSILVPTIDTLRYSTMIDILIKKRKQIFFTGETGVGKSVIIQKYISKNQDKNELMPINLNFSAQTNSNSTQQTIESKLDKKKGKEVLGAKGNNTCVIIIDDVNMPSVEKYGAQPPIELLRQLLSDNGFYDRPKFFWKNIEKFCLICAAAPPSGGRAPLTPRFIRHFHMF